MEGILEAGAVLPIMADYGGKSVLNPTLKNKVLIQIKRGNCAPENLHRVRRRLGVGGEGRKAFNPI